MNVGQALIAFVAVMAVFLFFAGSLTFARYKKRSPGCCGGGCQSHSRDLTHSKQAFCNVKE